MEISEYHPPSSPPSPPAPPRKDRSTLIMCALFAAAFLVTLGVANRHEIAQHFRHDVPASPAPPLALAETAKQRPGVPKALDPAQQSATNALPPLKPQTSQAAENSPFQ